MTRHLLVSLAILGYTLFNARDLALSWQNNPSEWYSWTILLIWTSPVIIYWTFVRGNQVKSERNFISSFFSRSSLFSQSSHFSQSSFFSQSSLSSSPPSPSHLFSPILLWMALILSFLGQIGSLNFLQHIGLACAISAFFPLTWGHFIWIITSVSWMTAWSWMGKHYFPEHIYLSRLILALSGVTTVLFVYSYHSFSGNKTKNNELK